MKNILILLTFLSVNLGYSQASLNYELFSTVLNWVDSTYDNPQDVIIDIQQDKRVVIEGFEDNLVCIGEKCFYALYQIEIKIEKESLRFLPMEVYYHVPANEVFEGIDLKFSVFENLQNFSDEDYEKTTKKVLALYKELEEDLKLYINKN